MEQLLTKPRYNVGILLLVLSIVLAITISSITYWRMIGLFLVSMLIGALQMQWGIYRQGKQTRQEALKTTLLFMAIATPALLGCAWLGYNWLADTVGAVLAGGSS